MTPLSFTVHGVPAPQGGMRPVPTSAGTRVITATSPALRLWRTVVSDEAVAALNGSPPFEGPVAVTVVFVLPRPKSARKIERWHTKRPDIDKLTRAALDSLTVAGVFRDDAQVAQLAVRKVLADQGQPWTGARFVVQELEHIEITVDTLMSLVRGKEGA